jgi:hypothetical protein
VILLILLIVGLSLLAVLWAGTLFLQGYFYTEPTEGITWRAPAAAAILTLFYALWCLLDYNAEGARPMALPYDTVFRFSNEETKGKRPAVYVWAYRKNEKDPVKYRYYSGEGSYYLDRQVKEKSDRWRQGEAVAIEIEDAGQKVRYEWVHEEGRMPMFVSEDGWRVREFDGGPAEPPTIARTGLWLVNMLLNLLHFGVWFACLWLLLRFAWPSAFWLAAGMWLVMTLTVLPMVLDQVGAAAQEAATRQ